MNLNVRILFLAHPRSGSSSLYQILQLQPGLKILEEPFNENFTRWSANNKNFRELIHDIPSPDMAAFQPLWFDIDWITRDAFSTAWYRSMILNKIGPAFDTG